MSKAHFIYNGNTICRTHMREIRDNSEQPEEPKGKKGSAKQGKPAVEWADNVDDS